MKFFFILLVLGIKKSLLMYTINIYNLTPKSAMFPDKTNNFTCKNCNEQPVYIALFGYVNDVTQILIDTLIDTECYWMISLLHTRLDHMIVKCIALRNAGSKNDGFITGKDNEKVLYTCIVYCRTYMCLHLRVRHLLVTQDKGCTLWPATQSSGIITGTRFIVKPVLSGHSKIDIAKGLKTKLMLA